MEMSYFYPKFGYLSCNFLLPVNTIPGHTDEGVALFTFLCIVMNIIPADVLFIWYSSNLDIRACM